MTLRRLNPRDIPPHKRKKKAAKRKRPNSELAAKATKRWRVYHERLETKRNARRARRRLERQTIKK